MSTDETYNGFANKETFLVSQCVSSDTFIRDEIYKSISDIVYYNLVYKSDEKDKFEVKIETIVRKSTSCKEGLYAELISNALDNVDWRAIAKIVKNNYIAQKEPFYDYIFQNEAF